ncbi:MAG: InlB B-repeat-containing protein [Oscillospiraceae bacterium]|nr:InlB B-repeat-containing protein [Oscillospiraceae bacterium]
MKKRILSFLLALLMVVSIFPAPAFATDSTDVTITPTETPTEAATEASCTTCGTVGCTSEHLNWCSDCQKDDCGQNHCDTCGAIDCSTEHKTCDKCGTLDCTADHTNWCADCKVDNCGQNHCPTCGTIDCTKEHKPCETCAVIDCTADHTNWCEICKYDNCGKDHNATEPTEAATEPVAAIDEGDEEEPHPMMGKYVKLTASTMFGYVAEPNWSYVIVGSYPAFMEISEVLEKDGVTYYRLKAAPNYSWPTAGGYSDDTVYLEATKLVVVTWCTECKEYDCGEDHTQSENPCDCGCENCTGTEGCTCRCGNCDFCERSNTCEICGENDCIKIHFWCDRCEDYDCGKSHLICPACGEVDCTENHTWCPYCAGYDCGMEHEDEYKPDTAPVIPANPTMTPGAEVSLVDEYGDPVTDEGFILIEGMKSSLSAWTDLAGDVSYQWQVCYNNANDLWVNIADETGKGILVSPAMFLSIIDYYGSTYVRCVATVGGETKVSDPIPVIVEEAVPQEQMIFAAAPRSGAANEPVTTADDGVSYSIIIQYKFENGNTAAQAYTASLFAGQDYVLDVESPAVVGYKPDQGRITQTITDCSGSLAYTVTYLPDYVDYKVVHYQQDISGNDYTAVKTETMTGLTGSPVGTGLEKEYDGFYDLVYDSGITVAADGSTVINIYYDRYYYLVSLDMNGGFGVEPIYARYGTYITAAALVPQRTGYSFAGWSPALPSEVHIGGSSHTAQWAKADTGFTVAFWYENANDEDYTFVGSVQQTAVTGSKVNGETYKDVAFEGRDDEHFTYEKADTNVEIAADGSSVVNVYFSRNTYLLEYYYYKCHHTHSSSCYSDVLSCGMSIHSHTLSCMSNIADSSANWPNSTWLDNNGTKANYEVTKCTLNQFYYVYYNGSFYRINSYSSTVNYGANGCPGYLHTAHSSSCYTKTLSCSHKSGATGWSCGCSNDLSNTSRWYAAYSGYHKYEEYVGDIHMQYGTSAGYRLIDVYRDGVATGETPTGGGAVGTFASMYGGYTAFYRSSDGGRPFYMTYWLESADGNGTRVFDGKTFVKSTTFFTMMSFVSFENDYQIGTPHGFNSYKATFGDADNSGSATDTFTNYLSTSQDSQSPYNNFYYTRKTYTLTYFNGSTQVATRTMKFEEPLTSTYNLQNLAMTSPYGSGYYFAGWCLDADCTIPVSWGSTKMPEGGMAVYAKWAPVTHTVTTYQTKGGTKLGTYTASHGTAVGNAPSDPVRDGYNFVTWLYEEDGTVKAYNFSMPVYKDLTLYAEWTSDSLASGTITYVDQATGKAIAEPTPITGLVGASKTYAAKTGTELNSGYQTGYFPAVSSHNIEFSTSESQNNWIFYYTKMDEVAYTVRYLEKDTNKVLHAETTGKSNAGKITVTHVTITGYAADAYSKDLVLSSDPALNVVTFYYTKDDVHAPVQVEHYIQNTTGTGYTHYFTEQPYNGNIGETQTAVPLTLTGFTYNSGISTNGVELTASGLVLKLYYDRNTYDYTFRFLVDGTTTELRDAVTGSGLYGAQVSQVAPAIPGYDLTTSGSLTVTIGTNADDNVRTFYYEEDTVTIRYQVGSVNGGTVDPASETVLAVNGDPDGSTATAAEDYVFKGWYTTFACNGTAVSTDANFEPSKNSDGVYEAKTYYAKFEEVKVTINYAVEMPDGAEAAATLTKTSEQVSILSGKAEGSAVDTIPEKYEFAGWYDADGNKVGNTESFVPTMDGDKWVDGTTYTAKFVEEKATINYVAVGNGSVTPATEEVNMVTGEAVGAAATATENVAWFVGWYDNAACEGTALSTDAAFAPELPSGGWEETQTYYAKFEKIQYTISFDTNGGTPATIDPISYVYGDTLTLPEVTNENYVVTWTVKENAGDWTMDSEVKNGTINHYGDVTLVANWTIDAIWIDWDFNILNSNKDDILYSQSNVPCGTDPVYAGVATDALAARRNTAQYTYTFKEWMEEDLSQYETLLGDEIKGIIVYRADYERTVNKYTVTWLNEDGTTIDTTEVEYGTIPTHTAPTKEETAEFTYTFAGWTPEVVAVTGDTTYKATFTEAKRSYTITWLNDDDSVIDTTSVVYGEVPTHADPSKAATAEYTYTFAGWSPEVAAVIGEATYKATYTTEKNKYTITWKNEDGTILETDAGVEYGTMPSYDGETPTKEPYNQYTYTFRAWSPEIVTVTGDAVYIASFDPHENFYTVTWVNHDGEVLETDKNVAWDTMPEYNGDTPEKTGNAEHSYTFAGWSPTVSKVNGHATYTATFAESVNTYTVTWKNEDGTVLETDEDMVYGAMPSYDGETPEKAATAQYTYTFDGWDKEVVAVTGDVTYTAKFSATVNKYTVTFVDEDGTTILKEATEYDYGTAAEVIVKPADPTKDSTDEFTYSFAGWTPEIKDVTGDATYTAAYTETKNQYTLRGEIVHGTVTGPVTVDYNAAARIQFKADSGYRMTGWSYSDKTGDRSGTFASQQQTEWDFGFNNLLQNIVITVNTAPIEYTITYDLRGGALAEGTTNPETYTVETETFTLNNPTKAGYKFMGWATSENANTGAETVTIVQGTTGDKTFYAVWEKSLVDLTITATTANSEQNFIFTVSGTRSDGVAFTPIDVVLCSENNFQVTIKDMPVGEYTVTEKDGWNWRENAVDNKPADLRTTSQTVSFDFGVVDDLHWLSGYSYRKKGGS